MECPWAYKYSYDGYRSCCKRFYRHDNDTVMLSVLQPLEACLPGERVACPSVVTKCKTRISPGNRNLVS